MKPHIGQHVRVVYHDMDRGGIPVQTSGKLGVEMAGLTGPVTAFTIEGDGSAERIPIAWVFSVEADDGES